MKKKSDRGAAGPRRQFLRTTLYVTPAVLTLRATPSFASYGSNEPPAQPAGTLTEQLGRSLGRWFD